MNDVTAVQSTVVEGTDEVLSGIFGTHFDRLTRTVFSWTERTDWHLAEDIASEAFLRLVRDYAGRSIDTATAFGLVRTIARHALADHFRLRRTSEAPADFGDWFEERELPAAPAAEVSAVVRLEARALLADRPEVLSPAATRQVEALTELAVAA